MARPARRYVCQSCGTVHPRWTGRCDGCGAWNTVQEEAAGPPAGEGGGGAAALAGGRAVVFVGLDGIGVDAPRRATGIAELDRVLGGGLVDGSAILLGGDPGIGKSTLLLQALAAMAATVPVAYVTGEEAIEQVRLRAGRLGLADRPVGLAAATSVRDLVATLDAADGPRVVVIDSIQTLYVDTLESAPGTVAQVRAAAAELIRVAKRRGQALLLVGHVTKDGALAGPRVLEHMVDTVLSFEGERTHQFRILRGLKNRFGATDEIGVFEMTAGGLAEVANPSGLFLGDRAAGGAGEAGPGVPGAVVFAGLEGTRPILVEIQALVAPSVLGTPRRAVVGWDQSRLAMILAVLEARCGVVFAGSDVYLNVAGGLRIGEAAADLAVAAALVSALTGRALPAATAVFGEVGLTGEVRPVARPDLRMREAVKLGFSHMVRPGWRRGEAAPAVGDVAVSALARLADLVDLFGAADQAP